MTYVDRLDDYDYDLPERSIAQRPAEPRDAARLLDALDLHDLVHRRVSELPSLLGPGDVVVVNDTRVIAARLRLSKPSGGSVELLLLEPDADATWKALVRPSRRVAPGTALVEHVDGDPLIVVEDDLGEGVRRIRPAGDQPVLAIAERIGRVPLPPYITTPLDDDERYQTVYARTERSVAAPTAGLHFTPRLLDECAATGALIERIELAVGLGTFRPIQTDRVSEHRMHPERYRVPASVVEACADADRVIAIGTTTVRALESAAATGSLQGGTDLFIRPGYEFKLVDVLLTNFHQPRSSLLVMLAAFMGSGWTDVYAAALTEGYRFLSFGDAMITSRPR